MARIIQTDTAAFLPEREAERQNKLQRMNPQQIGTLIRLADMAVSSPAIGAVANIAKAGLSKLGETFSEMGDVLEAKKAKEKQEAEAAAIEASAVAKEKESQDLFRKPLSEAKEPVLSGDEESFRLNLKKDYQSALSMEKPKESFSALRGRLKEGVDKGWIKPEFADKVAEKVGKNLDPKLKAMEAEASGLEKEEKKLRSVDFEDEKKDILNKQYTEIVAKHRSNAERLNQMANNLLVQMDEEKDPTIKAKLTERYQDALDSAQESVETSKRIEDQYRRGDFDPKHLKQLDDFLLRKYNVPKKAPGPKEPSAPQPKEEEEDLFAGEDSPIQKAAKKIVQEGRSRVVLGQLKDSKSENEKKLFEEVLRLEIEKRKAASAPVPVAKEETDDTGTGEFESRVTKKGEKIKGISIEPRMKRKAVEEILPPFVGFKGKKESLFPKKGSVQGRETVEEYDIGDLSDPEVLKRLREVPEEKARELAVEKKLSKEGILEEADQERKEEAKKLGRESQALFDEAQALRKKADDLRKAPLPNGVSMNPDGSWNLPERKKYSQYELLGLAAKADTNEKKEEVMKLVDQVDVSATTLGEMISGSAKKRFAEQAVRLFPKLRSTDLTAYQKALLEERRAKLQLQLASAIEKEKRAKSKAERDAAIDERRKIKDELDIVSKKQEAGLESPEERGRRKEISGDSYSLVESQIERNLRAPPSLSIDLRKEGREEKKETRRDLDDQINTEQQKQKEARDVLEENEPIVKSPRPKDAPEPDSRDEDLVRDPRISARGKEAAQKRIETSKKEKKETEEAQRKWDIANRKVESAREKHFDAKKEEERLRALKALEDARREEAGKKGAKPGKKAPVPKSAPSPVEKKDKKALTF